MTPRAHPTPFHPLSPAATSAAAAAATASAVTPTSADVESESCDLQAKCDLPIELDRSLARSLMLQFFQSRAASFKLLVIAFKLARFI